MTRYLTAAILVLIAFYGVIEAWPLIMGPTLSITSPANDATVHGGIVAVSGTVTRATLFTLNGTSLPHDQDGSFSSTLTFPHGGSILTFVAADRFGRTVTATRNIFVPITNSSSSPNY